MQLLMLVILQIIHTISAIPAVNAAVDATVNFRNGIKQITQMLLDRLPLEKTIRNCCHPVVSTWTYPASSQTSRYAAVGVGRGTAAIWCSTAQAFSR